MMSGHRREFTTRLAATAREGTEVNLPNALTLTRIFLVPLIVVVLLTTLPSQWSGVPQQVLRSEEPHV